MKTSEESLCALWDTIKRNNICIMGVPEGGERETDRKLKDKQQQSKDVATIQ